MIGAILAALIVPGIAGARSGFDTVSFWFSGTAFQTSDYYANTSQGLQLEDRKTTTVTFQASCAYRIEAARVRPGEPLLCNAKRSGTVLGRIEDEYPSKPQMDCVGTVRFRPGAAWFLGGTLGTGNLIRSLTGAPFAPQQLVVTDNNPLRDACSGLGLQSDQENNKDFVVGGDMRYPSGSVADAWTADLGSELAPVHVMFSAQLIGDETRNDSSKLDRWLYAVKNALDQWWNAAENIGKGVPATVTIQIPSMGTLQATWTAAGSAGHARDSRSADRAGAALFTVDQRVRAGAVTLHPRITPLGRAVLAGSASAPALRGSLRFTPVHGRPVRLTGTFRPQVVPAISSVQFTGTPANPTIIIRGRGLAPLPPTSPTGSPAGHNGCPAESGDYGSDYGSQLNVNDLSKGWAAGLSFPTNTDCIGLIPTKVTAGELDLRLGSFYTDLYPKFSLASGDQAQVVAAGAPIDVHVSYGAPVTS